MGLPSFSEDESAASRTVDEGFHLWELSPSGHFADGLDDRDFAPVSLSESTSQPSAANLDLAPRG